MGGILNQSQFQRITALNTAVRDFDFDESRAIISYFSYGHLHLEMFVIRKTNGSKSWVYNIPGQSVVDFVFDPFFESNKIE